MKTLSIADFFADVKWEATISSINELADGLENALDIEALLKDANW